MVVRESTTRHLVFIPTGLIYSPPVPNFAANTLLWTFHCESSGDRSLECLFALVSFEKVCCHNSGKHYNGSDLLEADHLLFALYWSLMTDFLLPMELVLYEFSSCYLLDKSCTDWPWIWFMASFLSYKLFGDWGALPLPLLSFFCIPCNSLFFEPLPLLKISVNILYPHEHLLLSLYDRMSL